MIKVKTTTVDLSCSYTLILFEAKTIATYCHMVCSWRRLWCVYFINTHPAPQTPTHHFLNKHMIGDLHMFLKNVK